MLPTPSPGVDCGCGIASYIPIYTQRKPQNWQCAHEHAYTPSQAVADWARIMGAPMGAPPLLGMSPVCVKIWSQGCVGFMPIHPARAFFVKGAQVCRGSVYLLARKVVVPTLSI